MEGTDGDLVVAAKAGEAGAFRELVERHGGRVFQLAYRITGNEQDAEDAVQESFLRAYRQLGRFDGNSSFGTWLYRIGANCALQQRLGLALTEKQLQARREAERRRPLRRSWRTISRRRTAPPSRESSTRTRRIRRR